MRDGANQRNGSAVDAVLVLPLTLVKHYEGLQLRKGGVESAYFGGGESNITARQMPERWKDEIKRSKYYISIFF